ncbi:uncharacterized protein VTP21DRAFT_7719 [Calcarisporiella thermophila]|uniref:uncharacterized protein n=1 Tax=Calcarisporiella thermophila TaxID=911321 RepID=UPI0037449D03
MFAQLPQQLQSVVADTAQFLHSFARPPPKAAGVVRKTLSSMDIPSCLRKHEIRSIAKMALCDATKILRQEPHVAFSSRELLLDGSLRGITTTYPFTRTSITPLRKFCRKVFPLRPDSKRFVSYNNPFRFVDVRRLSKLEVEANASPKDARKQAEFYRELLKSNNPSAVIHRIEKGVYAQDEECLKCYISALAQTNQTNKIYDKVMGSLRLQNMQNAASVDSVANGIGRLVAESARTGTGGKENPIYVVVAEAKGYMFWRALRWIGITFTYAFCILTFLSIALENSGLLKASGTQTEYEPSSQQAVKFSDVHGVDEAKQELEELVEFLKDPSKFTELGGKLPKGVLLTGPPGTGKTLLARAVAGEAGVPFFFMSGSEFDEMYVGVGARRVRELFAAARRKAPSIVFIDELDAIGSKRNPKDQSYMKQTLNQLLVDLDGFSQTEGVVFIAATNFPELLDKALVRPGRFDRHVAVPLPDVRGRMQILEHHMRGVQLARDVDVSVIARGTPGFSGADLANLVNQAAIQASREASRDVSMRHLEYAKDKILMGAERRSAVITEESKRLTAYHESGHALLAYYTPGAMPLHKATIMPRGSSLGMTVQLPEMDKDSYTRREYIAMIDVCMGGRVAEELIFGKDAVTSGAHNDIMKATEVAKRMVTQFGMSDRVGPVNYPEEEMGQLSAHTKEVIESEIRALVENAEGRALNILKSHKDELHRLAKALIEFETLSQEEIIAVIKGKSIHR